MNPEISKQLHQETVSAVYPLFMLAVAAERGVAPGQVLANSGVQQAQLQMPSARISGMQQAIITYNLLKACNDPGLGMEIGLRARHTKIGMMGFGLMSCATYGEALALGMRYLATLVPFFSLALAIEGTTAAIVVKETRALGSFRDFSFDNFLTEIWTIARSLIDEKLLAYAPDATEIWFDRAEPAHFARYKDRLPQVRWGMPSNQLRFDARLLDLPIGTANAINAQMVIAQCEREMALLGYSESLLDRVRAHLICRDGAYPQLASVAAQLHMSDRSLKRKLHEQGVSFLVLLDEVRRRDSTQLLQSPKPSIEEVARRLGYTSPNNFVRAFKKWTGETPSGYRRRMALASAS